MATNFSLTFVPSLATASVTDETVLSAYISQNASTDYDTIKAACTHYRSFAEKMTEAKFREFFGTSTTRSSYLNAILTVLDKSDAGQSLLAAYNRDNGWTNSPQMKERINYTVNLTTGSNNFDSILNSIGIASSAWSAGGKFQLIFNFVVGTGGATDPQKSYTVGVEWTMNN